MKINTDEIREFVSATVKSISQTVVDLRTKEDIEKYEQGDLTCGLSDYYELDSSLDFEISIAIQKAGNGKINLLIADIGANYKKEVLSKIKFKMDSRQNRTNKKRSHFLDRLSKFK